MSVAVQRQFDALTDTFNPTAIADSMVELLTTIKEHVSKQMTVDLDVVDISGTDFVTTYNLREFTEQQMDEISAEFTTKIKTLHLELYDPIVADKIIRYLRSLLNQSECPVCMDVYDSKHRALTLVCKENHYVCGLCAKTLQKGKHECPICRANSSNMRRDRKGIDYIFLPSKTLDSHHIYTMTSNCERLKRLQHVHHEEDMNKIASELVLLLSPHSKHHVQFCKLMSINNIFHSRSLTACMIRIAKVHLRRHTFKTEKELFDFFFQPNVSASDFKPNFRNYDEADYAKLVKTDPYLSKIDNKLCDFLHLYYWLAGSKMHHNMFHIVDSVYQHIDDLKRSIVTDKGATLESFEVYLPGDSLFFMQLLSDDERITELLVLNHHGLLLSGPNAKKPLQLQFYVDARLDCSETERRVGQWTGKPVVMDQYTLPPPTSSFMIMILSLELHTIRLRCLPKGSKDKFVNSLGKQMKEVFDSLKMIPRRWVGGSEASGAWTGIAVGILAVVLSAICSTAAV